MALTSLVLTRSSEWLGMKFHFSGISPIMSAFSHPNPCNQDPFSAFTLSISGLCLGCNRLNRINDDQSFMGYLTCCCMSIFNVVTGMKECLTTDTGLSLQVEQSSSKFHISDMK